MDIKEEKKYTKQQMLCFAETCMLKLLSTKSDGSEYSEISSLDLRRVEQVLNNFKEFHKKKQEIAEKFLNENTITHDEWVAKHKTNI